VLGGDVGSGLKDRSNGRACGSDIQCQVLMMVVDIRPWRGEVQGWWQVRCGLSYVRLFC
jgi:hypothetical protein